MYQKTYYATHPGATQDASTDAMRDPSLIG